MSERVDVTAMCLACATTRPARAVRGEGWQRLCRPVLRCKTCETSTDHRAIDKLANYGHREDGLRIFCAETNRLVAKLALMPNVDLRWSEGDWCLAHSWLRSPSLEWLADHPGEGSFPCICDVPPKGMASPGVGGIGAQPAGRVIPHEGRFLVELDSRAHRELLAVPLRELIDDLEAGRITGAAYLARAYNLSYEVEKAGAAKRGQTAAS